MAAAMATTMAVSVAPSSVALRSTVSSSSSSSSSGAASFAPLRLGESSSSGFSSCALRSFGVQELSRPCYAYGLSARGGAKRDFLLTGEVLTVGGFLNRILNQIKFSKF